MNTTRRVAAILAADVVGYSRLMGIDEVATLKYTKAAPKHSSDRALNCARTSTFLDGGSSG
jgi:hypothetical protein